MDISIWANSNSLSREFCKSVIDKFEIDENKFDGEVGGGYRPDLKKTKDLLISKIDNWSEEDSIFHNALSLAIDAYKNHLMKISPHMSFFDKKYDFMDGGYQIQKYELSDIGSGFYDWHHDFTIKPHYGTRMLTFLWYLNDVEEGGETEFIDGTKITPEAGKIILFPSSWNYVHRGNPPLSGNKYVCTGWLYAKLIDG